MSLETKTNKIVQTSLRFNNEQDLNAISVLNVSTRAFALLNIRDVQISTDNQSYSLKF